MKKINKATAIFLLAILCVMPFSGCSEKKSITIYTAAEENCMALTQQMLEEEFPEYDIQQIYMDTGSLAAKLLAEGTDSDADIILELENSYLEKSRTLLAKLDSIDFSVYMDDLVPQSHKYVPAMRMSAAIVIDPVALEEKDVPIPTSYEDLLKPEYKGLISMPNPKSSGTGYIFLLNLINEWGEDAAFEYFDNLAENLNGQGFTTSGSGPVKSLVTQEAAVALGMTFHAAQMINDGNDFEILFFSEGAPYTTYSNAVIEGKQNDPDVMKVFEFICTNVSPKENEIYAPEPLFKGRAISMDNFPQDIPYGDMSGIDDMELKERLLDKWNH